MNIDQCSIDSIQKIGASGYIQCMLFLQFWLCTSQMMGSLIPISLFNDNLIGQSEGCTTIKEKRGGSMRATILPWAIILTKAHRAAVSMMAKGSILTRVLPLRWVFFCKRLFRLHNTICSSSRRVYLEN